MTIRAMTSELEGRIADAIGWGILIAMGFAVVFGPQSNRDRVLCGLGRSL